MGKSSLVKAVHADINRRLAGRRLSSAEAHRDPSRGHRKPAAADGAVARCAVSASSIFCDDLSFDAEDTSYKSLKAVLEGGIEGRPANVIFYATSNRRHLLPRDMIENERSTAINPGEAVEEKVSLSDRFGLWLGFHKCSQDEYLAMVSAMRNISASTSIARRLEAEALEWADDARRALGPHRLAIYSGSRRTRRQGGRREVITSARPPRRRRAR